MNLLSIVWDWNPTLIMLGNLDIRWYGLMWAIAILAAERVCYFTFKREGLPSRTLESAFLWIVLGNHPISPIKAASVCIYVRL